MHIMTYATYSNCARRNLLINRCVAYEMMTINPTHILLHTLRLPASPCLLSVRSARNRQFVNASNSSLVFYFIHFFICSFISFAFNVCPLSPFLSLSLRWLWILIKCARIASLGVFCGAFSRQHYIFIIIIWLQSIARYALESINMFHCFHWIEFMHRGAHISRYEMAQPQHIHLGHRRTHKFHFIFRSHNLTKIKIKRNELSADPAALVNRKHNFFSLIFVFFFFIFNWLFVWRWISFMCDGEAAIRRHSAFLVDSIFQWEHHERTRYHRIVSFGYLHCRHRAQCFTGWLLIHSTSSAVATTTAWTKKRQQWL